MTVGELKAKLALVPNAAILVVVDDASGHLDPEELEPEAVSLFQVQGRSVVTLYTLENPHIVSEFEYRL